MAKAQRAASDLVQLKVRAREDLRRKLEREAEKRNLTINAEILRRLELSFQPPNIDEVFGGARNVALFRMFAAVIADLELQTGKPWDATLESQKRLQLSLIIAARNFAARGSEAKMIAKLLMETEDSDWAVKAVQVVNEPGPGLFGLASIKPEDSK